MATLRNSSALILLLASASAVAFAGCSSDDEPASGTGGSGAGASGGSGSGASPGTGASTGSGAAAGAPSGSGGDASGGSDMGGQGGESGTIEVPELLEGPDFPGLGYTKVLVHITGIDYPTDLGLGGATSNADGEDVMMVGFWLKEKSGDAHNWNITSAELGDDLKGKVTDGSVSFITYHNPADATLNFKVFAQDTWNAVVTAGAGDMNLDIPMGDFTFGDVLSLDIDASGLTSATEGSVAHTTTAKDGASDFRNLDTGHDLKMVTFSVSNLPSALEGEALTLHGKDVFDQGGDPRDEANNFAALTETVSAGKATFTYFTNAAATQIKLVDADGEEVSTPRLEGARSTDTDGFIVESLAGYSVGDSVLIKFDASKDYAKITE